MSIGKNTIPASASYEVVSSSLGRFGAFGLVSLLATLGACLSGCDQQIANAEQPPAVSSEPVPKALDKQELPAAPADVAGEGDKAEEDPNPAELRRGYGVVDMRFNPCVTRKNDYTFTGEGCPTAFVIFGPYVSVPASSEIDVSFEVQASSKIDVYADIVSQMGSQTLAGLNRTTIDAGLKQKLGYRVHVFNADTNVESRIGMAAEPRTTFEITNLTMTVR
jgi:hypothetical protein